VLCWRFTKKLIGAIVVAFSLADLREKRKSPFQNAGRVQHQARSLDLIARYLPLQSPTPNS
jgi:hypothetical protein